MDTNGCYLRDLGVVTGRNISNAGKEVVHFTELTFVPLLSRYSVINIFRKDVGLNVNALENAYCANVFS